MKKVVVALVIIVVVIVAALAVVPFLFKNQICDKALEKANGMVDAKIEYGSFSLSLFRSFPDFYASFKNVSIVGLDAFEGDTLLAFDELSTTIDLASVIKTKGLKIEAIMLERPTINLLVNADGKANWDIAKPVESKSATIESTSEESSNNGGVAFLLDKINVKNLNFTYNDQKYLTYVNVVDASGSLSGKMKGMTTLFNIDVATPQLTFAYDSIKYIDAAKVNFNTKLNANLETFDFQFLSDETTLNGIPLEIDGGFSMPNDSIFFKLGFAVPGLTLNDALGLIPVIYQSYIQGVEASGNVSLEGRMDGVMIGEQYPAFNIRFELNDVVVKYPDLPDALSISEASAAITKPQGDLDLMQIGISKFDMSLADNPFSMHAIFSTLLSDPHFDVKLDGILDLASILKVVPVEGLKLEGLMNADATIIGNYSAVENEAYDQFISTGKISLKNFYIENEATPQGVNIGNAALVLNNQEVKVEGLNGKIGRSDFALNGKLDQFISWFMGKEELKGNFALNSNLIDANEFMQASRPTTIKTTGKADTTQQTVVEPEPLVFPDRMDLVFHSNINHLLFDNMDITNFKGKLSLKNQVLNLEGLTMNMLDGSLAMSGKVIADGRKNPDVDFNLGISKFDLPTAARDISMVGKFLPFAKESHGRFSANLALKSKMTNSLKMAMQSISSNGNFSTHNVQMVKTSSLNNLKSVIKTEKLKNITLKDFTAKFSIKEGNLKLQPFNTAIAEQPTSIGGTYNLGGTLDFRVDATVDKLLLSDEIQEMIAYIPGHQNVKKIDVGLNITGDAKKPDIKVDTDKIKEQVMKQLKNSSPKELEDAAKKLLQQFFR